MPNYAIHNEKGEILRTASLPADAIEAQLGEGEFHLECHCTPNDAIDMTTMTLIKRKLIEPSVAKPKPYVQLRQKLYPTIPAQLDMLFRDVKNGAFGEEAKQSQWFRRIELVKAMAPKTGEIDPALKPVIGQAMVQIEVGIPTDLSEVEYLKRKAAK